MTNKGRPCDAIWFLTMKKMAADRLGITVKEIVICLSVTNQCLGKFTIFICPLAVGAYALQVPSLSKS